MNYMYHEQHEEERDLNGYLYCHPSGHQNELVRLVFLLFSLFRPDRHYNYVLLTHHSRLGPGGNTDCEERIPCGEFGW